MLIFNEQRHPFHLVDPSPHPLLSSIAALNVTFGGVLWFNNYIGGFSLLIIGFITMLSIMGLWWRDIVREATYEGNHTHEVQFGLRMGMLLFIVSEVMFFFAFFWGFFNSSLAPAHDIGGVYPPQGITILSAWQVPLLNTIILLCSGATITYAHHAIVLGSRLHTLLGFALTVALAVLFTMFQVLEYYEASFTISDSVYGSTFFMATGFHGFHVVIGTCFIFVCLIRTIFFHFTREQHLGAEFSIWYWHFVDVVWLFLFISIYWWGC